LCKKFELLFDTFSNGDLLIVGREERHVANKRVAFSRPSERIADTLGRCRRVLHWHAVWQASNCFTFEFPTQFVLEILIVFRIMNIVCGFDILRQRCKVVLRSERKIFGWFYFKNERLFLMEEWD
jgi:hypothetical protein